MSTTLLDEDLLKTVAAEPHRPLLFGNATVHTLHPVMGDLTGADLLLNGNEIAGVGTGLHTAAEDDGMIVVDCAGLTVVPGVVENDTVAGLRRRPSDRVGTLAPGNPATFAVISGHRPEAPELERIVWRPEQAAAIVVEGEIVLFNGRRLVEPRTAQVPDPAQTPADSPYLGMWIDETGFIHQELTADGRYDETRGGRPHAYQGSFWIEGDRIVYRDDLGFWAYGRFADGVLHHAGYVFHRR
ncbi:amidohydrolase [Streptomonospora alba]|uniref:Amidohydrolase n=1 Tax=Streptomonospora alba TaxID=183763 RepID=A0A0C2J972_9ACTN|nr:Atu4866 domain-containing protein [Streptomonospora alba]KIH98046.1 amidohydrolase [Streptomonospora alba]